MRTTVFSLVGLALFAFAPARADDQGDAYERLLKAKSPATVTIKCVLKMKTGSRDQEMESENTGVMIDPKGIVLCSNTRLSGPVGVVKRLMGSAAASITVTPTQIKVLVGDSTEGLDARFLARDTELDLAWIQIKDPGEQQFEHVDLADAARPRIGEEVYAVYRTSKHFDRTPVIRAQRVGGVAHKPRELYMADDVSAALGLPAYNAAGKVLGVVILQMPDDEEGSTQLGMLSRMSSTQELYGSILPAAEVVKATKRAHETAATRSADDDGEGEEEDEEEETDADAEKATSTAPESE